MAVAEDVDARSLLDQTDIIEVSYWNNWIIIYLCICCYCSYLFIAPHSFFVIGLVYYHIIHVLLDYVTTVTIDRNTFQDVTYILSTYLAFCVIPGHNIRILPFI